MQTDSPNGCIALVSLLTILLMPYTLVDDSIFTNSQYPNNNYDLFSSGSLGDPFARPYGNLPGSNGLKIDSSWATDNTSLKLNSNLQDRNPELLLIADANISCPKRRDKRGQNKQTYCKSSYSRTISTPTPEVQEGKTEGEKNQAPEKKQALDDWQQSRLWLKLDEALGQTVLLLQLRFAGDVEPEDNLQVCNKNGIYLICYPYKYLGVPQLVVPTPIIKPYHFCV